MSYLETVIPQARQLRIPISRDQAMLLMAAVNEIFLGVDIFLAHSTSGTILGGMRLKMPLSKTRAYFFMVSLGILATVISSVFDHARTNFVNPWLWIPTVAGIFGVVVALGVGIIDQPRRPDLAIYTGTMLLLIAIGVFGSLLHIQSNLTSEHVIVGERFLRGAPFMAPLLFADMGTLGLLVLLDPQEKVRSK